MRLYLNRNTLTTFLFCALLVGQLRSQNLVSTLHNLEITSTYAIIGLDTATGEIGIAVATNNISVGNSTIYLNPEIGAVSVIADTEPDYGLNGLQELAAGSSIKAALEATRVKDENSDFRQVAGMDLKGNTYSFTGESLRYWQGDSGNISGNNCVVIGNQLGDSVLVKMITSFENSDKSLTERLLAAMIVGFRSGGQLSGERSAALVVKGKNNEWFQNYDLRVDNSSTPLHDLQVLYDYHQGRIALNQSFNALGFGNKKRAGNKLQLAEKLLEGWDGMYSKLAVMNTILGSNDRAAYWVNKGLQENAKWKSNLPAFYYLREEAILNTEINTAQFSVTDWENAVQMFNRINQYADALSLVNQLFREHKIQSTSLCYSAAEANLALGRKEAAIEQLNKAIKLDPKNKKAIQTLDTIIKN